MVTLLSLLQCWHDRDQTRRKSIIAVNNFILNLGMNSQIKVINLCSLLGGEMDGVGSRHFERFYYSGREDMIHLNFKGLRVLQDAITDALEVRTLPLKPLNSNYCKVISVGNKGRFNKRQWDQWLQVVRDFHRARPKCAPIFEKKVSDDRPHIALSIF